MNDDAVDEELSDEDRLIRAACKKFRAEQYRANKAEALKESALYRAKNRTSLKQRLLRRIAQRKHRANNRDKINKSYLKKKQFNPAFRIRHTVADRIRMALKSEVAGARKSASTMELVGCTTKFLKSYLEQRFKPGMTWQNYGPKGWHIDHVIPCASFDLTKAREQRRCFHYTNLQPLWAHENLLKSGHTPAQAELFSA